jgi:protein gp37
LNNTKIEWCDRTWNLVTGCLHGCLYCYARKQVARFKGDYKQALDKKFLHEIDIPKERTTKKGTTVIAPFPYGFEPTFYHYRLDEPQRIKKPQNVFVCSMADLFGEWVPDEWIRQVFEACAKAPQHRYLFLTKNSKRYNDLYGKSGFPLTDNFWFGTTKTKEDDYCFCYRSNNTFLSIEPIQEEITFKAGIRPNLGWVIIGAETGNRKGKIIPERKWIANILSACWDFGIPVFMKDSLAKIWGAPLIQEYPWKTAENIGVRV